MGVLQSAANPYMFLQASGFNIDSSAGVKNYLRRYTCILYIARVIQTHNNKC